MTAAAPQRQHAERMTWHLGGADDRRFREAAFDRLPPRFRVPMAKKYLALWQENREQRGFYFANDQLRKVAEAASVGNHDMAASNAEIIRQAERHADECFRVAGHIKEAGAVFDAMQRICDKYSVNAPANVTQAGAMARMVCPLWWRRALRKAVGREVERVAIGLGLVHRRAGCYASDETVARRQQQRARNRALLASMIAVNEAGQEYSLEALAALGTASPAIRRGELMTRIAGFEVLADSLGHVGEFYTLTAPSRFHARLAISGDENPKHSGETPRQAQTYLRDVWARARAALHRREIRVYGFRVAEAHHDGTPHWHLLLFMAAQHVAEVRAVLGKYALQEDGQEAGAAKSRFTAVAIDKKRGSAAGYIAKYIAKNIDAHGVEHDLEGKDAKSSAARVDAWAACWGIRQFQQIGGAPVSVWRELRRLDAAACAGQIAEAADAADKAEWWRFVQIMGGPTAKRAAAPVGMWRRDAERAGKYGDIGRVVVGVVDRETGETEQSRVHTWAIKRGAGSVKARRGGVVEGDAGMARQANAGGIGAVRDQGSAVFLRGKGDVRNSDSGGSVGNCAGYSGMRGVSAGEKGGGGDVVGFEFGADSSPPWSPVNNCTEVLKNGVRGGGIEGGEAGLCGLAWVSEGKYGRGNGAHAAGARRPGGGGGENQKSGYAGRGEK